MLKVFLSILSFYFCATLVPVEARDRKPSRFHQKTLKRGLTALSNPQLVINQPVNNDILIANTTFTLEISSNPFTSGPVNITTTFSCTSGVFTVYSDINDPTLFLVPADASGVCTVSSSAVSYTTSDPITVFIQVPMYYEGTDDSIFHSGQLIDILVRPSNDAAFPTIFRIQCGAVFKDISITTTIITQYTLPSDLTGQCNFTTPNPPTGYLPISPFEVEIIPSINFISPSNNTVYPAGATISIETQASDGSNPVITLELYCQNTIVSTLTQPSRSIFTFPPNPMIYGSCTVKIAELEDYYTDNILNISQLVTLKFAAPVQGAVAAVGIPFKVQVTGTAGTSSILVNVTGTCAVGGTFTRSVNLNQLTEFTLDPGYEGRCTLTASVNNDPYFSTATTFITVYVPISPQQAAEFAESVVLSKGVYDLTVAI